MSISKIRENKEREDILRNDQKVRQGATFHDFAQAAATDVGGRFANAQGKELVVGSTPGPIYPKLPASSPWAGVDPVGQEPFLGSDINSVEPCGSPSEIAESLRNQSSGPLSSADGEPTRANPDDVRSPQISSPRLLRRF
jgi:hypothetical protein